MTPFEQSVALGVVIVLGLALAAWRHKPTRCALLGHSFPVKDPRVCRRCKLPYTEWWSEWSS